MVDRRLGYAFTRQPGTKAYLPVGRLLRSHGSRCPMLRVRDFARYDCKLRTFEYTTERLFDGFDTDHKFLSLVFKLLKLLQEGTCVCHAPAVALSSNY
jgi:hypothetical protein